MQMSTFITDNQSNEEKHKSDSSIMPRSLVIDNISKEDIHKQLIEVLDENDVLKDTIKLNNQSMKDQYSEYLLIASCQEDMIRTHKLHQDKFAKTKALVDKLREENKKFKDDISGLQNPKASLVKAGPSSEVEFVSSPDDDTINKLTAQLELIENQRRELVVENEKLTWQRESLERIVSATAEERDKLKDKLNTLELQLSSRESNYQEKTRHLDGTINNLQKQLTAMTLSNIPKSEIEKKDEKIMELERKVLSSQNELKKAQIKMLDLESYKMDFATYKARVSDKIQTYRDQMQELNGKLTNIQIATFKPVHVAAPCAGGAKANYGAYIANVKLYEHTLKHLGEYLNDLTNGISMDMVKTMGVIQTLQDVMLQRATIEQVKEGLSDIKNAFTKQHDSVIKNITQLKGTLSIFEGIFKDYNELLKKTLSKTKNEPGVEQLTSALLARGEEVLNLENEVAMLIAHKEDSDLLKTQVELYRSDFETERKYRDEVTGNLTRVMDDYRLMEKKYQERKKQLIEVRKMDTGIYQAAVARVKAKTAAAATSAEADEGSDSATPSTADAQDVDYTCPKCKFTTNQYLVLQDHFDICLDNA